MAHGRDLFARSSDFDVLARAKDLERIDPGIVGRLNEILALGDEQPFTVALAA